MALPALNATFASSADLPRKQMLAKWLVEELGETQAPSNVLVSGLSVSPFDQYNGIYKKTGESSGRNVYSFYVNGIDTSEGFCEIGWNGSIWYISNGSLTAGSDSDVAYPWLATGWYDVDGFDPTGVIITESAAPSPLSNYYSLPESYLWAKIAVAAGAPKTEADYISLPTRYVWSDIYNAVSGNMAQSTVVVSGLNNSQYNGNYLYDGEVNGKPKYRLNEIIHIYWDGGAWNLQNDTGGVFYSTSNVSYPWLATGWVNDGIDPTGLVITPKTSNHTDWSEKEALGRIAAAYRGDTGNPANLATYIDWPWRYKVAAIIDHLIGNYNAVIVSGLSATQYNGNYVYDGLVDGRPKYRLNANVSILWDGEWVIFDSGFGAARSGDDVAYPWLATGWYDDGIDPTGLIITPTNV